jgi:hypothetical protein
LGGFGGLLSRRRPTPFASSQQLFLYEISYTICYLPCVNSIFAAEIDFLRGPVPGSSSLPPRLTIR